MDNGKEEVPKGAAPSVTVLVSSAVGAAALSAAGVIEPYFTAAALIGGLNGVLKKCPKIGVFDPVDDAVRISNDWHLLANVESEERARVHVTRRTASLPQKVGNPLCEGSVKWKPH